MDEDIDLQDTELHDAVRYGDLDEVHAALALGHDPNQIGMYEWTPLHEATCNGDEEILRELLQHGGDPNKKDRLKEFTSVHYAAKNGHLTCLKMLLGYGGRYDVMSNNKETCLDVATKECLEYLEEHKINNPDITDETNDHVKPGEEHLDAKVPDILNQSCDECSDSQSVSDASSTKSSWVRSLGQNPQEEPIAGFLHLSFEYNSKKSSLKIRVWQLSEILLPPVETSMFSAIYVKSYLQPDVKHHTKRKTEELKLDSAEQPITKAHYKSRSHDNEVSLHAVFQPMCFKFTKSLDYEKLTSEMVATRTVEIVVCVVQKYTRRSYTVAKRLLPLKDAVKKLVREKVALKPCMQTGIQETVRPYPKDVLKVVSNYRPFGGSNPNVRVVPLFVSDETRASSDSDLKSVAVNATHPQTSVVLTLPTEDPSEIDTGSLQSISVEEIPSSSLYSVSIEGAPSDYEIEPLPSDSGFSVSPQNSPIKTFSSPVYDEVVPFKIHADIEGQRSRGRGGSLSSAEEGHMTRYDTVNEGKPGNYLLNSWVSPNSSRSESPASIRTSSSRPETPSWDSYMQPLEITGVLPIDAPEEVYHPPMPLAMGLPNIDQSFCPVELKTEQELSRFHVENDQILTRNKIPEISGIDSKSDSQRLFPVGQRSNHGGTPPWSNAIEQRSTYEMNSMPRPDFSRPKGKVQAKRTPLPGQVVQVKSDISSTNSVLNSETSFMNSPGVKSGQNSDKTHLVKPKPGPRSRSPLVGQPANLEQSASGGHQTKTDIPIHRFEQSGCSPRAVSPRGRFSPVSTGLHVSGGSVVPQSQRGEVVPSCTGQTLTGQGNPSSTVSSGYRFKQNSSDAGSKQITSPHATASSKSKNSVESAKEYLRQKLNTTSISRSPGTFSTDETLSLSNATEVTTPKTSVEVAKERLRQKLAMKKVQVQKPSSDHELFLLGSGKRKPGSAQLVHLESDV